MFSVNYIVTVILYTSGWLQDGERYLGLCSAKYLNHPLAILLHLLLQSKCLVSYCGISLGACHLFYPTKAAESINSGSMVDLKCDGI